METEGKAFAIIEYPEGTVENLYISLDSALNIAHNLKCGYVLVCHGKSRYRFVNGSPDLRVIDDACIEEKMDSY